MDAATHRLLSECILQRLCRNVALAGVRPRVPHLAADIMATWVKGCPSRVLFLCDTRPELLSMTQLPEHALPSRDDSKIFRHAC